MLRRPAVGSAIAFAAVCLLTASARTADSSDQFLGSWSGDVEGMKETWTFKLDGDTWSATCVYTEEDKTVGTCHGKNIKFAGGKLTFVQAYDKKPRAGWKDNALYTVVRDGENVTITWRVAKSSGSRTLSRVSADSDPGKTVAKKDPPKDPPGTTTKPKDPPVKVVVPAKAKIGDTVRVLVVPVGNGILSLEEIQTKLKHIHSADIPNPEKMVEMALNLKDIKKQPDGVTLTKGLYYTSATFCEKDGKNSTGPTVFCEKPLPECELSNWKYVGEGVGTYFLISITPTDAKIYVFEAKLAK